MTSSSHSPAVELAGVRHLQLVETEPPQLTVEQTAAMNRLWEGKTASNPSLFDGPVVVCSALEWQDKHTVTLTWYRATYRLYVLRLDPVLAVSAPSLFVSVAQPTDDGRLLVGRMAPSTAAPGRWQLPGGTLEPPAPGAVLGLEDLRRHAARELTEEIGRTLPAQDLALWAVTRGDKGNIGVHFRAPACRADVLDKEYAALVCAERAQDRTPELDRIAFVGSPADVRALGGHTADFLPLLAARHAGTEAPGPTPDRR
ncbi:NUDIX hydrolase [Streptomyces sp. NPDC002055]|uniref:NUDIX hydrolase n=1 Tax=Streptomyces sp. NPDC002055 TaxID=3154534 RepID=UPI00331D53C1